MKKFLTVIACMMIGCAGMWAQKTMYVPDEWRNPWNPDTLLYAESDPDNKYTWSKSRSVESENIIVLWDKGYGSTLPSKAPSACRVDEQDLLKKCEQFFDLEINTLGFVNPENSNLNKYKVMVLLNHTTDWVCFGSGYDYEVSALWLGPSACKPVGHSVAHEVGHSFHYMCYSEAVHNNHVSSQTIGTGFHLPLGNGQAIWEQTAQWQAAQSYPQEMFSQSINVFRRSHNYSYSHEWHRYQSYWFHYFLCQHYGDIKTVAQVWNQPMTGAVDFNQSLLALKGLSPKQLYALYFDYASRCATWDFEACAPYRAPYIGDFAYQCVNVGDTAYQVAMSSAPQATGFNVIPLKVPQVGTKIVTHFSALKSIAPLATGDPAEMLTGDNTWAKTNRKNYNSSSPTYFGKRGFRLGYVALLNDGTRQYFAADSVYCHGSEEMTEDVSMTVPEGVSRLWLIVSPSPDKYYAHRWNDKNSDDDQWPYRFSLEGTDLGGGATVYTEPTIDGREVSDVTLTYDVYFPVSSSYIGATLTLSGKAAAAFGTAFQMHTTDVADKMVAFSASGPAVGKIMFYPCNPNNGNLMNRASTANGYGHWFNASGTVSAYSDGFVYSEFDPSSMTFTLGQYPGKCANGNTYKIVQALRYKQSSTKTATARFVFNIHIDNSRTGTELQSADYVVPTAINAQSTGKAISQAMVYDLSGTRVKNATRPGIYVTEGRKVMKSE